MWEEDIVMNLLESLLALHKYLITAIETMPMKELTIKYVTAHLMHEMSKHKKNEPQGKDTAMVLHQSKADDLPSRQGIRMCFYYSKPYYITKFYYKVKNKEREDAKNTNDEDEFIFAMQHGVHLENVCK